MWRRSQQHSTSLSSSLTSSSSFVSVQLGLLLLSSLLVCFLMGDNGLLVVQKLEDDAIGSKTFWQPLLSTVEAVRILPNTPQEPSSTSSQQSSQASSALQQQQQQQQLVQDVVHPHESISNHSEILTESRRKRRGRESEQQSHRRLKRKRLQQQQRRARTVNVDVPDNPDGHLIMEALPLQDPPNVTLNEWFPTKQWSGHLPASPNGDKYFFYWLFAPDTSPEANIPEQILKHVQDDENNIPLVIWLNGGPGCSSMDGLFLENGPFRLVRDDATNQYKFTVVEHSWHASPAYVLYIDQPVGTGLSFTTSNSYPNTDEKVATDFYYFFQEFLRLHSDKFVDSDSLTLNRPFYFTGESYAGHYIPVFVDYIVKRNDDKTNAKKMDPDEIRITVSGMAVGNGWTDPYNQYAGATAAYGHGLIGLSEVTAFDEKEKKCKQSLDRGIYYVPLCFDLIDDIVDESYGAKSDKKVCMYDIRQKEQKSTAREYPYGHKVVETYLGGHPLPRNDKGTFPDGYDKDETLGALHATAANDAGQIYSECADPPWKALSDQDGKGVTKEVVNVLEHNDNSIRVLFFNGIYDMVCHHVGNEIMLEKLQWTGREAWIQSKRYAWSAKSEKPDQVSGYIRQYKNLLYLKLLESGHMVPMDTPDIALDMLRTFLFNVDAPGGTESFVDSVQSLSRGIRDETTAAVDCPVQPTQIENPDEDTEGGTKPSTSNLTRT